MFVDPPCIRRVWFEAVSEPAAREICGRWGLGFKGAANAPKATPLPEVYKEKQARELLGGVCRATLYRWITLGKVDRVPNFRHVLITRESIERGDWRR